MRFHSCISESDSTEAAVEEVAAGARSSLGSADVAFVFFTGDHRENAERIVGEIDERLGSPVLIGCSAQGVLGAGREIEKPSGIALLAGSLPDVRAHSFQIRADEWDTMLADRDALRDRLGAGDETRAILLTGDPFSTPLQQVLAALDAAAPGVPVVGGMASASHAAGGNVLLRNDETLDEGIVGVSLSGPMVVDTVVSQGCRPLGRTFVITKAKDNIIEQLSGRPAMTVLGEMLNQLPPDEQALLEHGLFIGRAISEYRDTFGRGDFLVRNVIGVDEKRGSLAVADYVRVGQTVQFQVRDASTASEDLAEMLGAKRSTPTHAGGLLFSCNGRGSHMFGSPGHDIEAAEHVMERPAIAGFFAAGEIGPVGGKSFVHGHTASLALFRPI